MCIIRGVVRVTHFSKLSLVLHNCIIYAVEILQLVYSVSMPRSHHIQSASHGLSVVNSQIPLISWFKFVYNPWVIHRQHTQVEHDILIYNTTRTMSTTFKKSVHFYLLQFY